MRPHLLEEWIAERVDGRVDEAVDQRMDESVEECGVGGLVDGEASAALIAVGAALLLLGAVGATVTQRNFEQRGRASLAPLALVPFGVLIGAGASMMRGWDLWTAILVGAILVPVVGAVGRIVEVRRRRRRQD